MKNGSFLIKNQETSGFCGVIALKFKNNAHLKVFPLNYFSAGII
jgi:hypothetical protein